MIPLGLLPGATRWAPGLDALAERPEPLWIHGGPGSGTTTLAAELAGRRDAPWAEAEGLDPAAWLATHPRGVLAAHAPAPAGFPGITLRLPAVDEDPHALPGLLTHLAAEEGAPAPLPEALGRLPCPGNLRELRARVVRWKLLGQLPEAGPDGPPRFDAEDMATNLHALERYLLHRALRRAYGNRLEAAQRLGVSRRQLYLLIRRHGDPVRGEAPTGDLPVRLKKRQTAQNSSAEPKVR